MGTKHVWKVKTRGVTFKIEAQFTGRRARFEVTQIGGPEEVSAETEAAIRREVNAYIRRKSAALVPGKHLALFRG